MGELPRQPAGVRRALTARSCSTCPASARATRAREPGDGGPRRRARLPRRDGARRAPDRRQLDGRQRRRPHRGEPSRPRQPSGDDRWGRAGDVQPDDRPKGIKLLVQFVEDPTRERLVAWMESMVYDTDDPHRRVRRAAVGGGERTRRAGRRQADVQPQDPQRRCESPQADGRPTRSGCSPRSRRRR